MTEAVKTMNRRIKKKKGLLSDPAERLVIEQVLQGFQEEADALEHRVSGLELPEELLRLEEENSIFTKREKRK